MSQQLVGEGLSPHAQVEAQAASWIYSVCGGPVKARSVGYTYTRLQRVK